MVDKTIVTPLRVKRGGRYLETKRSAPRKKKIAGSDAAAYKGVRMRAWGKWVTEIRDPLTKTRIWLGSFATAEMAARAYDAAVVCLKGLSAPEVNFPDSIPSFVIPQCYSSPREIQAVALAAATASVPVAAPLAMAATPEIADSEPHDAETPSPQCSSSSVESWIDNELCAFEGQEAVVEPMRRRISDAVEQVFLPWPDEYDEGFNCFTNFPDMHLWSFA